MFVGCRSYTYHYRTYFLRSGIDYWTSDIDPIARIWGERRKHVTCDVKLLGEHVPRQSFDLVVLNGVFGYGVDDVASMDQAVSTIRCALKDNAHLLVGWNKDRVADPERLPAIAAQFDRNVGLPLPFRKELRTIATYTISSGRGQERIQAHKLFQHGHRAQHHRRFSLMSSTRGA